MATEIYGLYYMKGEAKRYFYVGRSNSPSRRMREHLYRKRFGHEDVYERIRQLDTDGESWAIDIIQHVTDEEYFPDAERWHVIRLTRAGHELMNMRHGSIEHRKELAEQVQFMRIRNAADVQADRKRRKFQSSKRLRRRIWKADFRKRGIPDVKADTLLPPIFKRRLLAQLEAAGYSNASVALGWDPDEFVRDCLLRRKLSQIRAFREWCESAELYRLRD